MGWDEGAGDVEKDVFKRRNRTQITSLSPVTCKTFNQRSLKARSSAFWLCRELAITEDTSSTGARWSCLHHGGACSRGGMYRNLRLACTIIDAGSGRSLHFRMESFCVFHTHVCMFARIFAYACAWILQHARTHPPHTCMCTSYALRLWCNAKCTTKC